MGKYLDAGIYVTPILAEFLNANWESKTPKFYDAWQIINDSSLASISLPLAGVYCVGSRERDQSSIDAQCTVTFYQQQGRTIKGEDPRLWPSLVVHILHEKLDELNLALADSYLKVRKPNSISYSWSDSDLIPDAMENVVEFSLETLDDGGSTNG